MEEEKEVQENVEQVLQDTKNEAMTENKVGGKWTDIIRRCYTTYKRWVQVGGISIIIIVFVCVIGMIVPDQKEHIISAATLEKIINVSELSTFEAIYNGITQVMDEEEATEVATEVAYYVAYNAKVKAGIDFEAVEIQVDTVEKQVEVTLPPIHITSVNVDIGSLDFIFEDKKANTNTVSEEAYKACIKDVTKESEEEEEIYNIAKQNATNVIRALIDPLIKQVDDTYIVQID